MKYLCIIYYDENALEALPQSEWDALIADCERCSQDLLASGHFLAGDALEATHTATTVRLRQGRLSATDGPFAETKEQLGGFCLIEARDLDEAIAVAGRLPPVRYGCIEVRPVRHLAPRAAGAERSDNAA